MTKTSENHSGRCLCGAVRFEAAGAPLWIGHCHCQSCRRHTGSAVATFVGFATDRFTYLEGTPKTYASSPGVTRSFCGDCGTPLTYEAERFPNKVEVYVSTFDRPQDFPPEFHVHVGEQLPWLHLDDGLPRYLASSTDAQPIS